MENSAIIEKQVRKNFLSLSVKIILSVWYLKEGYVDRKHEKVFL